MRRATMVGFGFMACLILGVGFGLIFNSIKVGGTIGFGVGLILLLLFRRK